MQSICKSHTKEFFSLRCCFYYYISRSRSNFLYILQQGHTNDTEETVKCHCEAKEKNKSSKNIFISYINSEVFSVVLVHV